MYFMTNSYMFKHKKVELIIMLLALRARDLIISISTPTSALYHEHALVWIYYFDSNTVKSRKIHKKYQTTKLQLDSELSHIR